MDIRHLPGSVEKNQLYDNGTVRISKATPIDESFKAEQIPSVIYHRSEADHTPTVEQDYSGIRVYKRPAESPEASRARFSEMISLFTKELAKASAGLKQTYDMAMEILPEGLRNKDWGFSVTDGEMVFIEGSDELSSDERSTLTDAFRLVNVEEYARMAADDIIGSLVLARGPAGVTDGFGRFDVSHENFAEIVNLRAYLGDFEPGGKYHHTLTNPNDLESLFFIGGVAMMDQISARAEASYAVPPDFGLVTVL